MGNQEPCSRLCSHWVLASLPPPPQPSIQSPAIPTSVAWQPGIYLKGRPHSNAYHQPALPAWHKPLQFLDSTPSETYCFAYAWASSSSYPIPSNSLQPKSTGDSGPHLNNYTFPAGWKLLFSVHRFCQPARLKSLLGPPQYSNFMGIYV